MLSVIMRKFKHYISFILAVAFFISLPWQTKLILFPAGNNYSEISLYVSQITALAFILWHLPMALKKLIPEGLTKKIIVVSLLDFIAFISIFFATYIGLAVYRYFILLVAISLYFIVSNLDKEKLSVWKTLFLVGLIPSSLLGIWQFLSQSTFASSWLGLAPHDAAILGTAVIENSGRWLRAYGSFDHPNIFGGINALAAILSMSIFIRKGKRLYLALSLLFVFSVFISFSRAAILALVVSLVVAMIEWRRLEQSMRRRILVNSSSVVIFLIVLSLIFFPLVSSRTDMSNRLEAKSINERASLLEEGRQIIFSHPIIGVGLGSYIPYLISKDSTKKADWNYQPVHNSFILIGAELGLFGLFIFLAFFVLSIKSAYYSQNLWLIAGLAVLMSFDHWFWSLPFGVFILFFFLSLVVREKRGVIA